MTWTRSAPCSTSPHRSEEVSGLRGVTGFLAEVEGQQIPADTLGEADLRGSAVRLLTAHRAKGLEWDLVVVAGVQEGAWPDIRRRGSLLEPDRLGPHGLTEIEPTASRIAEERRLFYVACTRARRRLVVTAVAGTEGEGDQPSRFLTELGAPVRARRRAAAAAADPGRAGRRAAPDLRRPRVDPRPAGAGGESGWPGWPNAVDEHGRPLVPMADPVRWWGMRELLATRPWPSARRTSRSHLSGSQLGRPAGLPAAVVPVPQGPGRAGSEHGRDVRLGDPRARRPRGAVRRAGGRAGLATWSGLGSARASTPTGCRRSSGPRPRRRWSGSPPGRQARPEMELLGHRGPVRVRWSTSGSDRVRLTGSADRVERDPAGPDPDRRLQDLAGAPRSRRRRRPGPARGLPARGAGRRLRRAGRSGRPTRRGRSWSICGSPDAPSGGGGLLPKVVPPGLAGRRAVPDRRSRRRTGPPATVPADLDLQPTWVHRRLAVAAHLVRRERFVARIGPGCRYCPFRPAARPSPRDGRWCR